MTKKVFYSLVLLMGTTFILDYAIGNVLEYYYFKQKSGPLYRITQSVEYTNADIIVFGASTANHHYTPESFENGFGMSFYTVGKDGSSIFYHLAVLKSVLKRHIPKMIILDWEGHFNRDPRIYERLSSLLPYYKTNPEMRAILEMRSTFEKLKLISKIYPYNSMAWTILMGNLDFNIQRKKDNKGYLKITKEWKLEIDSLTTYSNITIDKRRIEALHDFLFLVSTKKINTYVVLSPRYYLSRPESSVELCSKICAEYGITFYDFSQDSVFLRDKTLFADLRHLNHKGSVLFSKILTEKIANDL